jgi:hypothetical protein
MYNKVKNLCYKAGVVVTYNFFAAPAPSKNFDAALAPTLLFINQAKF